MLSCLSQLRCYLVVRHHFVLISERMMKPRPNFGLESDNLIQNYISVQLPGPMWTGPSLVLLKRTKMGPLD